MRLPVVSPLRVCIEVTAFAWYTGSNVNANCTVLSCGLFFEEIERKISVLL